MKLSEAYDPEAFRALGHQMIDGLADYLTQARDSKMPVLPVVDPTQLRDETPSEFPEDPQGGFAESLLEVVSRSNHLHHPGYVGHQVSVVIPPAILAEMTSALLSNGMAVFEMGQLQTVMERAVVKFLASKLGFPSEADGVLTHGGSLGNFTALLAARQAKAGHDIWTDGHQKPLAVLVSDQSHYCISRTIQAMGWGAGGIVSVPTDDQFRLDPQHLQASLDRARSEGRQVIAVVANSCSTATGSFDPLPPIADFCAANDLWMHVDGAHGASLAFSDKYRGALEGIERADSVVWDLHKMLGLPSLNTAVLFREGERSYESFAQQASYLFDEQANRDEWHNIGLRTMECTKRGLGVTAYTMLRSLGTRVFADKVERLMDLTRDLADILEGEDEFEMACPPEANILCFRHLAEVDDLNAHQVAIRQQVLERGNFYLVQTKLGDATWLRVTIMNPFTTMSHFWDLVEEIREVGE